MPGLKEGLDQSLIARASLGPPLGDIRGDPPGLITCKQAFFQDGAASRIHMMDLMTYRTGHRLIDVTVLGGVFSGEALNAVSSLGTAVHEERHAIE